MYNNDSEGDNMGSDCTVQIDDGCINIRVGAIIMKDGKFLMVQNDRADYLYSVGGRIKFGETAQEAVVREVYEETGVKMEVDRLGFIYENFFYGDYENKRDKLIYEISYFFYMRELDNYTLVCDSVTDDHYKEHLVWVSPTDEKTIYPSFFKTELIHPVQEIKFMRTDQRKK